MDLTNKTIALYADLLYQEMELWYPLYRMQEAGVRVVVVGAEAGKIYTSKLGYPVKSEAAYKGLVSSEFDGVIVPGGFAPDYMRRHAEASTFVRAMDEQDKLVAAICHGPWMLCQADVLRGRKATSFFAIKTDVTNAGAEWSDEEVVRDRNLVTSRKPEDLPAFMKACLAVLGGA